MQWGWICAFCGVVLDPRCPEELLNLSSYPRLACFFGATLGKVICSCPKPRNAVFLPDKTVIAVRRQLSWEASRYLSDRICSDSHKVNQNSCRRDILIRISRAPSRFSSLLRRWIPQSRRKSRFVEHGHSPNLHPFPIAMGRETRQSS